MKKKNILINITALLIVYNINIHSALSDIGEGGWVHTQRQAPQVKIESIFSDSEGKIWAGTSTSLHVYDGVRWKMHMYVNEGLYNHSPFFIDPKGRLYFVDDGDLVIWENYSITRYDDVILRSPLIGAFWNDNIIYIGSYNLSTAGIYLFNGQTLTKVHEARALSLEFDNEGLLWATIIDPQTDNANLMHFKDGEWFNHTSEIQPLISYLPGKKEMTVQVAPDGAVWANKFGKYGIYKDSEWTFHHGGGAPVFLDFDRTGGVWGYGSEKLYKIDYKGDWELKLSMENGIANKPNFLTVTPDSTVWIIDSSDVYIDSKNVWVQVKSPFDLASDVITCLVYTDEGDLICGHGIRGQPHIYKKNHGISIRTGSTWKNYNTINGVELYNVYQLKKMPDNDIMAYTDGDCNFKIFDGENWAKVDSLPPVLTQTDMDWDTQDDFWITTEIGLIEVFGYGPDYDVHYPFDFTEYFVAVRNLYIDENNIIYMQRVDTYDIISFDGGEWYRLIRNNQLTKDFTVDDKGTIWAAREEYLGYWDDFNRKWNKVVSLDSGRFVHIDEGGRIWSSGFGNTGYLEDGTWHPIHELSESASDAVAISEDGRIVLNSFDSERNDFYGLYEFIPSTGVESHVENPMPFITTGNHPNPFNPQTSIYFKLPTTGKVEISIFSINGQKIKTFTRRIFPAGSNKVVWDSMSDSGTPAASGVYLYHIKAGDLMATGKMLLLR
ncbi:T9SS type A sorting domain-containing protein [Candidatus Latescibacterota bacterium]